MNKKNLLEKELISQEVLCDISEVEVDGVDTKDYPDLCDAYISYAVWHSTGIELSDDELDYLSDNHSSFVHECAHESLH